jgi:hypothetical protein
MSREAGPRQGRSDGCLVKQLRFVNAPLPRTLRFLCNAVFYDWLDVVVGRKHRRRALMPKTVLRADSLSVSGKLKSKMQSILLNVYNVNSEWLEKCVRDEGSASAFEGCPNIRRCAG